MSKSSWWPIARHNCRASALLALVACAGALVLAGPAAAVVSSTPDPTVTQTNADVKAIARSGSRVFLGGTFTRAGAKTPFGSDFSTSAGVPNPAFARPNGQVSATVSDGAGGWYIGGTFTAVGGVAVTRVAHLLADGSVATHQLMDQSVVPFAPGVDSGSVNALALSADGSTLYVGGTFTSSGGTTRNRVAAFNTSDGALRPFNPNVGGAVTALALAGTTLYAGGSFTVVGSSSTPRNRAASFDTATGNVTSFDPNITDASVVGALLVSGGTVYAGGSFSTVNGTATRLRVASFDAATGALNAAFDAHMNTTNPDSSSTRVNALVLSGSTLYVGGAFQSVGSAALTRNNVAALDSTTGVPTSFDPNVDANVTSLALSGGTLFAGGQFMQVNGATSRNRVAAFDTSSAAATSFDPNVDGTVSAVAVAGGRAYLGGSFAFVGAGTVHNRLVALNPDGTIDQGFDANVGGNVGNPSINALVVSGGHLYAGGSFAAVNGATTRNNLAAFDPVSGAATAFDPSVNNTVNALAAGVGTVYAGGAFSSVNNPGVTRNNLAAFDGETGLVTSFDPRPSLTVNALLLAGTTLYAGGSFTTVNGTTTRARLAALDTTTAIATPFDANVVAAGLLGVNALAISGSTLYLAGGFTAVGATSAGRIAAVDATTGAAVPTFVQGLNSTANSLALLGDTLYVGGVFSTTSNPSLTRNRLVGLNPTTGAAVTSFDASIVGNNTEALMAAGTKLYVGGNLTSAGGVAAANLARFTETSVAPVAVTGAASAVTNTGATVAGSVNPGGSAATYTVEYGPSTSFGANTAFASAGAGTDDAPVSVALTGLTPDTTYFYRVVAKDGSGTSYFGSVLSFNTGPGGAPIVATGAATRSNTSATLAGTVDPHGRQTAFTFEYGTSTAFGAISAVDVESAFDGPVSVSLSLSGLTPDTTYFYRLVATNASGTTFGAVQSFATGPGGAPIVTTGAATAITSSGATIAGTVGAHGAQTAYVVEYGTTTTFGAISSIGNAGSSNGAQPVALNLSGLAPGTTYLYRLVATNANGTTPGAVLSFTTASAPA